MRPRHSPQASGIGAKDCLAYSLRHEVNGRQGVSRRGNADDRVRSASRVGIGELGTVAERFVQRDERRFEEMRRHAAGLPRRDDLPERHLRAQFLTQFPPPSVPVSLLYAKNRQLSPRVRVFIDWAAREFAAHGEA